MKGSTLLISVFSLQFILLLIQVSGNLGSYSCLLRACWAYCPSALTGWTCTTVLPTLPRRPVRRPVWHGRTSWTSSMNCWVSHESWTLHVCSLCWPLLIHLAHFTQCATSGVTSDLYISFSFMAHTVIVPAPALLQRETFPHAAQYLYSSSMACFLFPLTKCQVLILSCFSTESWMLIESFYFPMWAHIHHSLSRRFSSHTY